MALKLVSGWHRVELSLSNVDADSEEVQRLLANDVQVEALNPPPQHRSLRFPLEWANSDTVICHVHFHVLGREVDSVREPSAVMLAIKLDYLIFQIWMRTRARTRAL